MTLIFGYLAAALIGISLGLVGGGGSILTVPVLVYLFGVRAVDATSYSLFIVGATSAIGAINYARQGLVDFRCAVAFALPSVAGVYLMRRAIVPRLPDTLFQVGSLEVTKDRAILLLFGVTMLAASLAMIRSRKDAATTGAPNPVRLGAQGLGTGLFTGAIGAGGGFLIVPALALVAKVPMKQAVTTSLMVIALNSTVGFLGDLQNGRSMNWNLILTIAAIAIVGAFGGGYLSRFVSGAGLKKGFGYFVLAMGCFVIVSELAKG